MIEIDFENPILIIVAIEFVQILLSIYIVNIKQLDISVKQQVIGYQYFLWSCFLGFRNIWIGEDLGFDPTIFMHQAKTLSIAQLFIENFPKIDILLQIVMRLFYAITSNDFLTFFLSQGVIIYIFYSGTLKILKDNYNGQILLLSYMIFSNSGILLLGNFMRQGLAVSILLHIIPLFKKTAKFKNVFGIVILWMKRYGVAFLMFFSHMSSLILVISFFLSNLLSLKLVKKTKFWIVLSLIIFIGVVLFKFFFADIGDIYAYEGGFEDGGVEKLKTKLTIDLLMIVITFVLSYIYLLKIEALLMKSSIILMFICYFYLPIPVVGLRLEYYLNLLIFVTLAQMFYNIQDSKFSMKILSYMVVFILYIYSFFVYSHPSITKVLLF